MKFKRFDIAWLSPKFLLNLPSYSLSVNVGISFLMDSIVGKFPCSSTLPDKMEVTNLSLACLSVSAGGRKMLHRWMAKKVQLWFERKCCKSNWYPLLDLFATHTVFAIQRKHSPTSYWFYHSTWPCLLHYHITHFLSVTWCKICQLSSWNTCKSWTIGIYRFTCGLLTRKS